MTAPVTIAATDYGHPARVMLKGMVVELSAAEITAIGAGNMRAPVARDTLGLNTAVSNSD